MSQEVRLNKYLSHSGVASRRKADELIVSGKVSVNGQKVKSLGVKVVPGKDTVTVEGKQVELEQQGLYYAFNKPRGVLTTMDDPKGRPCVGDYIQEMGENLFPVGRLDWDSEGLIILTNNGDFAHRLSHPKYNIGKTYLVKVDGKPTQAQVDRLKKGVAIVGGKVKAEDAQFIKRGADKYQWLKVIITEGKNRQVRRMFEKIGYDVLKLQRVGIGSLTIGKLSKGQIKQLTPRDIDKLMLPIDKLNDSKTLAKKPRKKSVKRRN